MKQIAVMSGKGGAGKTSITAALAKLLPTVIAVDADVNASNLPILLVPQEQLWQRDFFGMPAAQIAVDSCQCCGKCQDICAFDAIDLAVDGTYRINADCEGCAACAWVCPTQSIKMQPRCCGSESLSWFEHGYLVHADLHPGADNSGKLIASIRQTARNLAKEKNYGLILIDGPPGTSCQAIASLTGVDLVVVVLEESLSGLSDYLRLVELIDYFRLPHLVVLNKVGIDQQLEQKISAAVNRSNGSIAARIPFDPAIPQALSRCKSFVQMPAYAPIIEQLCAQMLQAVRPSAKQQYGRAK